jgi:hypothetical protein
LLSVADILANAGRDTTTLDPGAVAAVEVCDGHAIATDAEEAVTSTDLRRRKSQIAVRTAADDDVVTNGDFPYVGRLILKLKDYLHEPSWEPFCEGCSDETDFCDMASSFSKTQHDFKNKPFLWVKR